MKFARVVKAKNVRVGDQLLTDEGPKNVSSVESYSYDYGEKMIYVYLGDGSREQHLCEREDFRPKKRIVVIR